MINENNIKIIVQESDETRPRGSGASSDIVYVPGLGNEHISGEYTNTPVLCSTIEEFELYFGEPYQFTDERNIDAYATYANVRLGDYDRSYIYAKELINAGLSVLYENISPNSNALVNTATFTSTSSTVARVPNSRNIFQSVIDGERNVTVNFGLTGQRVYGNLGLIIKAGDCESVELETIVSNNTKFNAVVSSQKDSATIDWQHVDAEDLSTVTFTLTLKVKGAGRFSLHLVEGDVAASVSVEDPVLANFYAELPNRIKNLEDKNEYTVKYITSGGYPTFVKGLAATSDDEYTIVSSMIKCAAARNDAVALIDHEDDESAPFGLLESDSVYNAANTYFSNKILVPNPEFGAMFTPWGDYVCSTMAGYAATSQAMPASFGYLLCLASAIKTSPNWLAMAGVSRGIVPNLKKLRTNKVLSNVIAEEYQPKFGSENNKVSLNAITNVKPYGLTIWGNRTLKPVAREGTVATNFLNTRNMISDIKKLAYNTAKSLMFEQDSDTLWLSFKSGVSPLLDQLKSGFGISDYKLIRSNKKYDGTKLTNGEMAAVIKIFPLYAIEYFEITVVLSDNDVAVS